MSTEDDPKQLRERVREQHARIEALEQTVADLQDSDDSTATSTRRSILGSAAAAAGLGGLGYGVRQAQAQASGPAGQVGTDSEPVDVNAWDLDVQGQVTRDIDFGGYGVTNGGSFDVERINTASPEYAVAGDRTLLEAAQTVPVGNNGEFDDIFLGEVVAVPSAGGPAFDAIDYGGILNDGDADTPNGVTLIGTGMQSNTPIVGSGQHAVSMPTNDPFIKEFSIRQEDASGDYDAINISNREARVENVGIDAAPRYGVHVDNGGLEAILSEVEISGGQTAGVRINSRRCSLDVIQATRCPNNGVVIDEGNNFLTSVIVEGCGGDGVQINSFGSIGNVLARSNDVGLRITNDNNVLNVWAGLSTNDDIVVSGDDNVLVGFSEGDVTVTGDNNDLSQLIVLGTYDDSAGTGNIGPD